MQIVQNMITKCDNKMFYNAIYKLFFNAAQNRLLERSAKREMGHTQYNRIGSRET